MDPDFEAEQPSLSPDTPKAEEGANYLRRLKTLAAEDTASTRCHWQHRGSGNREFTRFQGTAAQPKVLMFGKRGILARG